METLAQQFAPGEPQAWALAAATTLEHVGHLLAFLDLRLAEMAIFDPQAQVQSATVRDGIKVGRMICEELTKDGAREGLDPAVMRAVWPQLVEAVLERRAQRT